MGTHRHSRRWLAAAITAAAFAAVAVAGAALASALALAVAHGAKVTNTSGKTTTESIVVNSRGHAVYDLTGDTAKHPECTKANGCFSFWPPVTVSSAASLKKITGISGKLGTFHRDGFLQVTWNGHPLYTFANDMHRDDATGEGINGFGGIWHVLTASSSHASRGTSTPAPVTTTTSTTTSTPICPYCY